MHTPDLTNVGTNRPNAVKVSDQMWLNGVTNQLFGLQSDDDFLLSPDTGLTHIEGYDITGNDFTNMSNTEPVKLLNSGTTSTNGAGTDFECRFSILSGVITLEITNQGIGYIAGNSISISGAVFLGGADGVNDITLTVGTQTTAGYRVATGGGAEVDISLMEDLGNEYSLILG